MTEMPSIDTSGIDDLRKIKEEQDVYRDRIQKMQDMKEKVSAQVYDKVFEEYAGKLDALNAKAEPLKEQVRNQYAVLRNIMTKMEEEKTSYGMEREEMEFRYSLGEFDENSYNEQTRNWEMKNTSKQAELDEAQEMREHFLSVFDSEEDLEATEELSTVPVDVTMALPGVQIPKIMEDDSSAMDDDTDDSLALLNDEGVEQQEDALIAPPIENDALEEIDDDDLVDELDDSLEDLAPPPEELEDDLSHELTDDLTDDSLEDLETDFDVDDNTEDVEPPPPPIPQLESESLMQEYNKNEETLRSEHITLDADTSALDEEIPALDEDANATLLMGAPLDPMPDEPESDGTMIIANPKIISLNHATKGQVIVLGMGTTSLGRSPDNDIHLTEDRISRKHSQITFGPGGYAIYDLNSENGTFVNGNRVREHFLSDGDIITVGTFKYQYRDR